MRTVFDSSSRLLESVLSCLECESGETMSLSIERLESEILSLPEDSKAQLLGRLLESLAAPERKDDVLQAWAEEAERRDRAMSEDRETGRPAEEVLDRLR